MEASRRQKNRKTEDQIVGPGDGRPASCRNMKMVGKGTKQRNVKLFIHINTLLSSNLKKISK